MISILNRIAGRARKLLILMIVLPLITGAVAAVLEVKKGSTYTGSASVYLGNFDTIYKMPYNTDPASLIKTTDVLNGIKKSSGGTFDVNDMKDKLVVTATSSQIKFEYTGNNKTDVQKTINDLANGFVKYHNKNYDDTIMKLNKRYTTFANYKDSVEAATKMQVLDGIQSQIDSFKIDKVVDGPNILTAYSNPLKRGIFGLILGLMLDIVIIVLPEFFREYR